MEKICKFSRVFEAAVQFDHVKARKKKKNLQNFFNRCHVVIEK